MKMIDLCEAERPRERLVSAGCGGLSNGELLAVLLRSGTRDCSALELGHILLREADGLLCKLSNMSFRQLCSIRGVGPGKAATVLAALELGRRFMNENTRLESHIPITDSRAVYNLMLPDLKGLLHEECWVVMLNNNCTLVAKRQLTRGGDSSTVIDVKQVMRDALAEHASALVLVHNHPSGNPLPSEADKIQTAELRKAASSMGVALMDHVIFCNDCYFSFADDRASNV